MESMCIRCRSAEAPDPLGLCPACAMNTRSELTDGFKRLSNYLLAWAAFQDWLRDHRATPGS
jgi:hypothetical protein